MAWGPNISFDLTPNDFSKLRPQNVAVPAGSVRPSRIINTSVSTPSRFAPGGTAYTPAPLPTNSPIIAPTNGAVVPTPITPATIGNAATNLMNKTTSSIPSFTNPFPVPAPATIAQPTTAQLPAQQTIQPTIAQPTTAQLPQQQTTPAPLAQPTANQLPAVQTTQPATSKPAEIAQPGTAQLPAQQTKTAEQLAAETPPADPFQTAMADFYKTAKNWMSGQSDPAIRVALNHSLDQIGLQNQAQMDALRMQINQDPTLRGQGAGIALLSSMARDQNFKVDDLIANMSEKNLERIVNMQKYGFEAAMNLEKTHYSRMEDAAQKLLQAGDYDGAAKLLQQNAESVAPGLGLHITAESLKNRDPYEVNRLNGMISLVKDLAKTDPKAATSLLNSMIASNPTLKSWLPEGITAEQMIGSFVSGQSAANVQAADALGVSIRTDIANHGDFATVEGRLADLFKLQNRDPLKEGQALTLDRINEIRKSEGLPPIADKNELDEIDYKDLGYRNEFYKEQAKSNEAPWQPLYDMIMKSPDAAKFLDPALFPGGADAVKNFVINYSTGLLKFDYDPETGTLIPSASNYKTPWEDPALFPMFYHMPQAVFDENGKPVGEFSMGGTAFTEALPKTAAEAELQQKYAAYLNVSKTSGQTPLSAPQWYFATAGGTKPPDITNIPSDVRAGTSIDPNSPLNVGLKEATAFDPATFIADYGKMTASEIQTHMQDQTWLQNAFRTNIVSDPKFWSSSASGITIKNTLYTVPSGAVGGTKSWTDANIGKVVEVESGGKRYVIVIDGRDKGYRYELNSHGEILPDTKQVLF